MLGPGGGWGLLLDQGGGWGLLLDRGGGELLLDQGGGLVIFACECATLCREALGCEGGKEVGGKEWREGRRTRGEAAGTSCVASCSSARAAVIAGWGLGSQR